LKQFFLLKANGIDLTELTNFLTNDFVLLLNRRPSYCTLLKRLRHFTRHVSFIACLLLAYKLGWGTVKLLLEAVTEISHIQKPHLVSYFGDVIVPGFK